MQFRSMPLPEREVTGVQCIYHSDPEVPADMRLPLPEQDEMFQYKRQNAAGIIAVALGEPCCGRNHF